VDKITLIKSSKEAYGGNRRRILYWYDLAASPIQDGATPPNTIVVQKVSDLDPDALPYVDAAGQAALNVGDAASEILVRWHTASESIGAFTTRILSDHAARETWWTQDQRDRYKQSGKGAS